MNIIDGKRCSSAKAYLAPAMERPNLDVITGARTTRIVTAGSRATAVQYLQSVKIQEVEAAREILICAGAVQSPQILLLSGIGSSERLAEFGIETVNDLPGVGQNLQDHLDVVVQYHCTQPSKTLDQILKLHKALPIFFRYLWSQSGTGAENPVEAGGFVRSRSYLEIPDVQFHILPYFMLDHGRQAGPGSGVALHVCQLRPESRGEITLRSTDPEDDPLIKPNYLSVASDIDVLVDGVKMARRIFKTDAMADFLGEEYETSKGKDTDEQIKEFIRSCAETIYHPVGTCKMGSDSMAVVDSELRVHGMEGLRVVDASIMPLLIGGNTNAPTIMIGEKAADMILHAHSKIKED